MYSTKNIALFKVVCRTSPDGGQASKANNPKNCLLEKTWRSNKFADWLFRKCTLELLTTAYTECQNVRCDINRGQINKK